MVRQRSVKERLTEEKLYLQRARVRLGGKHTYLRWQRGTCKMTEVTKFILTCLVKKVQLRDT